MRGLRLFRRRRVEQDLHDEIRDHIERQIEEGLALGLTRDEARRAALRAFGGVESLKDECRDYRRLRVLEHTIRDLRYAVRHFARTPVTAATMILVFALGIGFNTALFLLVQSFVNGPVPAVAREASLVRIRGIDRSIPGRAIGREFSYPEFRAYAEQRTLFRDVAAWTSTDIVFGVGDRAADVQSGAATYVSASYFSVLGVKPVLGAGLPVDAPDLDPFPPLVAVISHLVWERHFERSRDAIGQTLTVNGVPITIVGVAPRRFAGARTGGSQMRIWLPLSTRPLLQRTEPALHDYDDARFGLVARLQPGIHPDHTVATVQAVAARAAEQTTRGPSPAAATADVVPLLGGNYFPPSGSTEDPGAGVAVGSVFPLLILLITCTSVSALLAGLAVARRREIAVRLAVGASRARIVRQLVTESVLLALVAGAAGLLVIGLLLRLFDSSIPDLSIEIDWRAFAFTFGLALMAGVVFGIAPALHATRLALSEALKDAAGVVVGGRLRLQSWLVVLQIALTQPALLGMAALLLEMRSDLHQLPAQAAAERIVDVRFNTNPRYGAQDDEREAALGHLRARLAELPGVAAVVQQDSLDDVLDLDRDPADRAAGAELAGPVEVRTAAAPEGYFPLMDFVFVRGRDFDPAERLGDGAVVIGADLARRLWGTADPIGRRVVGTNPRGRTVFTVVGVVDESVPGRRVRRDDAPRLFVPRVQRTGHLLVRTTGPADALVPTIRAAAAAAAPAQPIVDARTVAAIEASDRRSILRILAAVGAGGGVALLLSAIGLYALVAFAVRQRVREIGIHIALGASSRQVVGRFVRVGVRLSLVGVAIGLTLGVAGMRLTMAAERESLPAGIFGLGATIALIVIGVALLASWIPARRAARIDPLQALRAE